MIIVIHDCYIIGDGGVASDFNMVGAVDDAIRTNLRPFVHHDLPVVVAVDCSEHFAVVVQDDIRVEHVYL